MVSFFQLKVRTALAEKRNGKDWSVEDSSCSSVCHNGDAFIPYLPQWPVIEQIVRHEAARYHLHAVSYLLTPALVSVFTGTSGDS